MRRLGHERFAVVGHDRGRYVAFRDGDGPPGAGHATSPSSTACRSARLWRAATPASPPLGGTGSSSPSREAGAGHPRRPGRLVRRRRPKRMGAEAYADYRAAIHDPATVHAMLEDYRAGSASTASTTRRTVRAGRRLACPCWCCGRCATTWRISTATCWRCGGPGHPTCAGAALDCGHHMAEEAPEAARGRAPGVRRRRLSRGVHGPIASSNGRSSST